MAGVTQSDVSFAISPDIAAPAIIALRAAVGWSGLENDYPAALAGYWATVGGFDVAGELVAWCAMLSDSVRHVVLLDVIVHPRWQRRGVGRMLVSQAIEYARSRGITIVHVDFTRENATFYQRCGFTLGLGGIHIISS
jgi:GNAT superfamily N-acetyltransferase